MSACPHCFTQMLDAPELAGQRVRCPACRGEFQLPPRLWTEAEPPPVVEIAAPPVQQRPRAVRRRGGTNWPDTIRLTMLWTTGVWLAAVVVFSVLAFLGHYSAITHNYGHVVVAGGQTYRSGEYFVLSLMVMGFWGVIVPTVPYGIAMIALTVARFAARET